LEDTLLLRQIKNNDEIAFEILFRRYYVRMRDYALFYVHDLQQAEDIVQDIFLAIWQNRKKTDIKTSLKAYLYRSVHNSCIKHFNHLAVSEKYSNSQRLKYEEALLMNKLYFEDGISRLFLKDIDEILSESICKLPEKTRMIFELSREEKLKNHEIAGRVNLTEKAVEYHIGKALKLLRHQLRDYLPMIVFILLQQSNC